MQPQAYSIECLTMLADEVRRGEQTLSSAAQEVISEDSTPKPITRQWLTTIFQDLGLDYGTSKPGRPPMHCASPDLDDVLMREYRRYQLGAYRMWMRLQHMTHILGPVTTTMVGRVYMAHNLWAFHRDPREVEVPRCRYEAGQVNLIWHTDLHQYSKTKEWLMAVIDDASRRIMGWGFVPDKSARSTREVLKSIFAETPDVKSYCVWTDNGTEFKGKFHKFLCRQGIGHVFKEPYNPQQNGKMERFWPVVERAETRDHVAAMIDGYDDIPHLGLALDARFPRVQVRMSPHHADDVLPKWTAGGPCTWRVDGNIVPFQPPF